MYYFFTVMAGITFEYLIVTIYRTLNHFDTTTNNNTITTDYRYVGLHITKEANKYSLMFSLLENIDCTCAEPHSSFA
jgi:hypothetical protein